MGNPNEKPRSSTDSVPEANPVLKEIQKTLIDAFGFDFKRNSNGKGYNLVSVGTFRPVVETSVNGRTMTHDETVEIFRNLSIGPDTRISKDWESYVITVPSPSLRTTKIRVSAIKPAQQDGRSGE